MPRAPRPEKLPPPAPEAPKRPGRPRYQPTDKDRGVVALMIGAGIDQPMIAACIGISEKTMRRCYRRELATSYAKIVAEIAGKLIAKARDGDRKAQIFYLSTHGWVRSERLTVVDGGADFDVAALSDAEIAARIAKLGRGVRR